MTNMTKSVRVAKAKTWLFYLALVFLPLLQFVIFYICVNINSILLSFKIYDGQYIRWGLDNYKRIFSETDFPTVVNSLRNSALAFFIRVVVGMSLGLIFSFYIFKKMPGFDFFKVMLFLPTIVSSVVMVIMYRLMVEDVIPYILTGDRYAWGLLSNEDTKFTAVIIYNVWVGFGTQVLMYLGAMNNVNDGALEACKIDGANIIQEFLHVVFPGIYSTFLVFMTVNIAEFFTNQMALHTFFGFKELGDTKLFTLGYYMYREVGLANGNNANLTYPAALGILCTIVAIPITFVVKYVLQVVGPKED